MRVSSVRKLVISVAAAGLAAGGVVIAAPPVAVQAAPVTITLLNVNDFHGRIDTTNNLTTRWATAIEDQRAIDPSALLLAAGDLIGASLFNSAIQNDQPTIDVMNEMCLNASSVGNHEFDKGYTDLTARVINGTPGQATDPCPVVAGTSSPGTNAKWSYLGANVYQKGTQTPALPEYATFVVNGVTVGVIGAVTSEMPALVSPGGITQIDVGDPVVAVNRVADQLTDGNGANGEADVLVAEYHEGAPDATKSIEVNKAASPAFASIADGTSTKISVIFTGHTHQAYVFQLAADGITGGFRPVLQTGNYADHIGKVVLSYDASASPKVTVQAAANLNPAATPNLTYPRVAKVDAIVTAAKVFADGVGLNPIGSQTADITTAYTGGSFTGPGNTYVPASGGPTSKVGRDDRASESTMGGLVANMLRDVLAPANLGGAEIGVINPGGMRDEFFYAQTGVEGAGVITYAEANNVLPFVNNLWTTTITGAQFKTMLEQQWQRDANNQVPSRPYLQLGLSDNVTYTFDDSLPEGSRITSITINGAPYDPAGSYRIGAFSFLLTGGDNFRVLAQGTGTRDSGLLDRDGWIAYLGQHSPVSPDFARQSVKVTNLPTTVTVGASLQFGVAKLDLTSLGSPANTSLAVSIGGVAVGSVPVVNGAATVSLTVPEAVPCGAQALTAVASPSNTTLRVPVTVARQGPCSLEVTDPALRLLDTRVSPNQRAEFAPGGTLKLHVAGKYGIPVNASAVVLNLTSVEVGADGWIRAYACDSVPASLTSNLNQAAGLVVANLATIRLDSSGDVCFETSSTSGLIVDLQGWYPAGADYQPIQPTRVADTRSGLGISARLAPSTPVELVIAGTNGVAADASAVMLNLTAIAAVPGYVSAYPCGTAPPLASNLNAWPGHAIANSALVGIGTGGKICFVSDIATELIVDLQGWFPAGAAVHAVTPVRAFDSRDTGHTVAAGTVTTVPIGGVHGVPGSAEVVSVNVTAVNATEAAWLRVFACGQPQQETSNNNTSAGRTVATQALVPLGTGGAVCIVTSSPMDVVVDIQGWLGEVV